MPCQLKEAIELLGRTQGTKKRIQDIIDNGIIAEEKFGKLVKKASGKSVEDATFNEVSKGLSALIRDVTKVVVSSKAFALEQIHLGMKGIEFARFNIATGVEVVSDIDPDLIVTKLSDEFYAKVSSGELVGVDATSATLNSEVQAVFDIINDARGSHFLAHELLHAGTIEYMLLNPNEEATKRIEDIYTYLYTNHKELGITPGYWMTNVDEFIAEAISNSQFVKELTQVKPSKAVSKLTNMYAVILNNMLQLMGFKGAELESLFDVLLDSTLKILEESPEVVKKPIKIQTPTTDTPVAKEVVKAPVEVTPAPVKNQPVSEDTKSNPGTITEIKKEASADAKAVEDAFAEGDALLAGMAGAFKTKVNNIIDSEIC